MQPSMRTIAAGFIAVLVAGACAAQSDALLAPLPIRDQFLLNNGFFFFVPQRQVCDKAVVRGLYS